MKTLKQQKLERFADMIRHPMGMRFHMRQMWRGLVEGPRRDAMASDPEGRALFPARIFYTINSGCNLTCKMCDVGNGEETGIYYRNTTRKRSDYLTLAEVEAFAESLLPHRPEVILNGTEPTIHPELCGIIRAFTSRGMRCEMITNGVLLGKWAKDLVDARLSNLVMSIDGPDAATHDGIRGLPGAFDKAIAGLLALLEERDRRGSLLPHVSVPCVMQPANHDKLVRMAEWGVGMPINALVFAHLVYLSPEMAQVHNDAFPGYPAATFGYGKVDPRGVDPDVMHAQLTEVHRRFAEYPIYVRPDFRTAGNLRRYYHQPKTLPGAFGYRFCPPLYHSLQVYPNGDVNVANLCFVSMFGNLRRQSAAEIWNGEAYRKFRKDIREAGGLMPGCARCSYVACTTRIRPGEFFSTRNDLVDPENGTR